MVNGVLNFGDWHGVVHLLEAISPSAEDRLTVSQRSVEEGFRLQRHQSESARGRNPARVTVTGRRTAALDGEDGGSRYVCSRGT